MADWGISTSIYPTQLVLPLYVRDRLGLSTSSPVPPLAPAVQAIPSKHLDVAAASASWNSVWPLIARGGLGAYRPFAPVQFTGLVEHPALLGPWAWLYEEGSAWARDLAPIALVESRQPGLGLTQQLVEALESELGRPVKPFSLELEVLPIEGAWWHQADDERAFVSAQLLEDIEAYTALLRKLLEPIA